MILGTKNKDREVFAQASRSIRIVLQCILSRYDASLVVITAINGIQRICSEVVIELSRKIFLFDKSVLQFVDNRMCLFLKTCIRTIIQEILILSDGFHCTCLVETNICNLLVKRIATIEACHLHIMTFGIDLIILLEEHCRRLVVLSLQITFCEHIEAFLSIGSTLQRCQQHAEQLCSLTILAVGIKSFGCLVLVLVVVTFEHSRKLTASSKHRQHKEQRKKEKSTISHNKAQMYYILRF